MKNLFKSLTILLAFFVFNEANTQGIIVNEFSNGDTGSREYMEFLVIGEPCTTVDIREWIFDDNNGIDDATCEGFSTQDCSVGIAPGHARFKNIPRWSAVPVGSIILVYNDADKNLAITLPDDPTDSDNDLVYILPISDSGIEGTTNLPSSPTGCGTVNYIPGNCLYSPVTYSSPTTWGKISLNNTNDACQTRRPDGTYFHGFSYGVNNMTGGPNKINFSVTGTDKNFYLNCGHHSFLTDYSTGDGDISDGLSDETPGQVNNILNQGLVEYYRGTNGCGIKDPCVTLLNNDLIQFKGEGGDNYNKLKIIISSPSIIEHSTDGLNWNYLTNLNVGLNLYNHEYKYDVINYYRVFDKTIAINNIKKYTYIYVNLLGMVVDKNTDGLKIEINLSTGEKKLVR